MANSVWTRLKEFLNIRVVISTTLAALLVGGSSVYVSSRVDASQTAAQIKALQEKQTVQDAKIEKQTADLKTITGLDQKMDAQTALILDRIKSLETDIRELRSSLPGSLRPMSYKRTRAATAAREARTSDLSPLPANEAPKDKDKVVDVATFFKMLGRKVKGSDKKDKE